MSDDNTEQIDNWNGEGGARWVQAQTRLDALFEPLTRALLERAAPQPGERVLDVGCGCGDTSLALAALGADVIGVDVSAPMLARAHERGAGRPGLRWLLADATDHSFEAASVDLVLSRFGVMFFADSVRAFANLRRSQRPDGRLCMLCWQALGMNPWLAVPMQALQPFAPAAEPPAPGAPGPFAFADPERVTEVLAAAGYHAVHVEPLVVPLQCGDDLDAAVELVRQIGVASRILATLPPAQHAAALAAVHEALRPTQTAAGVVLGSAAWLVTALVGAP